MRLEITRQAAKEKEMLGSPSWRGSETLIELAEVVCGDAVERLAGGCDAVHEGKAEIDTTVEKPRKGKCEQDYSCQH